VKTPDRFELRMSSEDRLRLRTIAECSQRTEADVVRLLIRQVDPVHVRVGVPAVALPVGPEQAQMTPDAA
jgi:hypothetical protein